MKWISVKDRLPEHGKRVLAFYMNQYKHKIFVTAHYLERWKEECSCDDDCNNEYSEEKDEYFHKEDWYETMDNWGDYSSMVIHEGEVTHWMPLPEPPKED